MKGMLTDQSELKSLLAPQNTLCVSLYMPLRNSTPRENVVRAKNLLKEAEEKVTKVTCASEALEFLRPMEEAIPRLLAAQESSRGLAVFTSVGLHRELPVPLELPEIVNVGREFHILPLLPLFSEDDRFYILALSQKHIRVFGSNRVEAREIILKSVPPEFDQQHQDFLSEGFEKELQFHSARAGGSGKRGVVYHGGQDEPNNRFAGYLRQVSVELFKTLNFGGAPLVIASVERLASIYREINQYPNLVEGCAAGNPDLVKTAELHARAWKVMEPYFGAQRLQIVERFNRFPRQSTSYDAQHIAAAAKIGRVRTLLIGVTEGRREAETEELFNLAASRTLRDGGAVHALPLAEMPEKTTIAAAYRY